MITDSILTFLELTFKALIMLLNPFGDLITMFNDKVNSIIDFFIPIMEYVLYYFNVPVLITAITNPIIERTLANRYTVLAVNVNTSAFGSYGFLVNIIKDNRKVITHNNILFLIVI